jgi:co-chaperonin GroES (HSP10)
VEVDNIRLFGNRVLVELPSMQKKSPGGIVLPPTAEQERNRSRGVIYAIGDGVTPGKFLLGDEIMFTRCGRAVIDDQEAGIVDVDDIFLVYLDVK